MNIRQKFGKWEVSETGDMIWDGGRYAIYDYQCKRPVNYILQSK